MRREGSSSNRNSSNMRSAYSNQASRTRSSQSGQQPVRRSTQQSRSRVETRNVPEREIRQSGSSQRSVNRQRQVSHYADVQRKTSANAPQRRSQPKKKITGLVVLIIICVIVLIILLLLIFGIFKKDNDQSSVTTDTTEVSSSAESDDTTGPVIEGAKDITVHIGDTILYKSGVTVTDDTDPDPKLSVDSNSVNINKIGTYQATYTATDASGNSTSVTINVTVVEKDSILPETAYALADTILDKIITDGMTDYEKLDAVWWYVHQIGYTAYYVNKDPEDYLDNAYVYLNEGRGDCRCTYAAARLLIERLGYETTLMHSKDGAITLHYWCLVSVDGGENWYHFDPTFWEWQTGTLGDDEVCMMTDEWMKNYAQEHDYLNYDWNPEDFPEVSTTEFPKN